MGRNDASKSDVDSSGIPNGIANDIPNDVAVASKAAQKILTVGKFYRNLLNFATYSHILKRNVA